MQEVPAPADNCCMGANNCVASRSPGVQRAWRVFQLGILLGLGMGWVGCDRLSGTSDTVTERAGKTQTVKDLRMAYNAMRAPDGFNYHQAIDTQGQDINITVTVWPNWQQGTPPVRPCARPIRIERSIDLVSQIRGGEH